MATWKHSSLCALKGRLQRSRWNRKKRCIQLKGYFETQQKSVKNNHIVTQFHTQHTPVNKANQPKFWSVKKKKKKKEEKKKKSSKAISRSKWTPYRCLPCRGRGAYARSNIDLVNQKHRTKQNKTKKRKPKQESIYYKRSVEGFIVKNICCALLPATTSLKTPIIVKKI